MSNSIWVRIEAKIRTLFQNVMPKTPPAGNDSIYLPPTAVGSWFSLQREFSSLESGFLDTGSQTIQQDTLRCLQREAIRMARQESLASNSQLNRLVHLMLLAIQSGNISLAMMLFSHLEARSANEVTRILMEKVQSLQERKRELSAKLQEQKNDFEGSKAMQQIKTDMEQANDDISVLQTFIRDVAQNKQQMMELANAFLTKEHETTMAIVRSFAR